MAVPKRKSTPLVNSVPLEGWRSLPVIGLTVLVGVVVVVAAFAASAATPAVEPESAALSGSAKVVSTTGASGGKAIQFGSGATPAPTATPGESGIVYGSTGNGNSQTADCSVSVASGQSIQNAINSAGNGAVVCVKAADYSGMAITLNKAITLRANGVVKVRNVTVSGGATLDGFTVVGGPLSSYQVGIEFSGNNSKVINNTVNGRGIVMGISCQASSCGSGHVVANNTITGVHNYGIWIDGGSGIIVEKNNIYDLWRSSVNGDVDGMRFWGTNQTIRNNYIHDINEFKSAKDTGGDTPHADCFQNYDNNKNPTASNIVIENNYCVRVSRQCFISQNNQSSNYPINNIVFRGNVCETFDSQTINLGSASGITLENNLLMGGVKYQVVAIQTTNASAPSKNIKMRNNIIMKGIGSAKYYEANNTSALTDNTKNIEVQNDVVASDGSAFQGNPNAVFAAIRTDDFSRLRQLAQQYNIIDAGAAPNTSGFNRDIDAKTRPQGGAIDSGPFEIR